MFEYFELCQENDIKYLQLVEQSIMLYVEFLAIFAELPLFSGDRHNTIQTSKPIHYVQRNPVLLVYNTIITIIAQQNAIITQLLFFVYSEYAIFGVDKTV